MVCTRLAHATAGKSGFVTTGWLECAHKPVDGGDLDEGLRSRSMVAWTVPSLLPCLRVTRGEVSRTREDEISLARNRDSTERFLCH